MTAEEKHLSIVVCGHLDSGKSTTCGRLLFELGGVSEDELRILQEQADATGKSSYVFAFCMDTLAEERARALTIACTRKQLHTEHRHYTIIDAPGHRQFIKNMITGASQADVALIMVPADDGFKASIVQGSHDIWDAQGQTRQHARLVNLLGVKQICVGVNKMDCGYQEDRFIEIADEMKSMLVQVGWKKDYVEKSTPILPISGWAGDNLVRRSENMAWWQGQDIEVGSETLHVDTLIDVLDKVCQVPERPVNAPMRTPISGIYQITGVGCVVAGRVEQGIVTPGEHVVFLPTHTGLNTCMGEINTIEMHHVRKEEAHAGDIASFNITGLSRSNMPRAGDVMVYMKDTTLGQVKSFDAQVQVLDIPKEIKQGYAPIGFVRCGRAACHIAALKWKMGRETGDKKIELPGSLLSDEIAECTFYPQQPFVCDSFTNCEGLSRIIFMEGSDAVMMGKIVACERKEAIAPAGGKKK